jgi:hypothetical protein
MWRAVLPSASNSRTPVESIVIAAGVPFGQSGTTNLLRLATVQVENPECCIVTLPWSFNPTDSSPPCLRGPVTRGSNDQIIDESLRLVAIFMKLKDEKARAEILRLAERCAWFDARPSLHDFASPLTGPPTARIKINQRSASESA